MAAQKQPCPRCGWPTKFGLEVTRTDGLKRYVCFPCVHEVGEAQFASREQWLVDNQLDRARLEETENE